MIRISLATTCAALLGWHLALPMLPRKHHVIPAVERSNHHRAQRFVHARGPAGPVIAGSSMADRLDEIALGTEVSKLTFVGGGPLTGLAIVLRSGRIPPILCLETNMILRPADPLLLDDATAVWRTSLRDDSDMFKEEGRPSAFAIGILRAAFAKASREAPWLAGPRDAAAVADPRLHALLMQGNREHLSRPPAPELLRQRLDELSLDVAELRRRGTRVVFFDMPLDPTLASLPLPVVLRTALRDRFPPGTWCWFDPGPPEDWKTSDGIHLEPADATRFAGLIRDFIRSSRN